jgi:hypothetical protein
MPTELQDVEGPTLSRQSAHGDKVVSLAHCTPQKHFYASGTHLYLRLSKPQGLVRVEGLGKIRGGGLFTLASRTHDFSACSIVPQRNVPTPLMPKFVIGHIVETV